MDPVLEVKRIFWPPIDISLPSAFAIGDNVRFSRRDGCAVGNEQFVRKIEGRQ